MWPFDADPDQAANSPADDQSGGWGGMFTPGSFLDNPTYRRHAAYDALTNAGLGLIQASAPSSTPSNLGTMFGALAGGAAQGVQSSADRYMKQMTMAAQMQNMRLRQQMLNAPLPAPQDDQSQAAPQQATAAPAPTAGGGVNDNNIGNVRPVGASTGFQQPPDFNTGVALAVKTAQAYPAAFNGGKPMDLVQIGEHWAPKGDGANDPKQWAVNVSQHSGLPLNEPLDLSNPQTAAAFARGVHGAEKGAKAVQPPETYAPGVQLAQSGAPMPQGGDQPTGNQPGVMPAPQAGLQIPPMPKAIPYSPMAQRYIASGDKGLEALGKANNAQVDHLNAQRMERWKQNAELLRHNQTEARERQGMDLRTQNADVMPGGNPNQAKIEYKTKEEMAKKTAETEAQVQNTFGGKGWENVPNDQFRKMASPKLISLADGLQKGTVRLSTLSNSPGRGGTVITKEDVQAAGMKLYGDQWNPDSGDIRHKFEQDIKDPDTQAGKTVYALNTVLKHLDRFQDLTLAQKNGTAAPLMTKIRKELNDAAGYAKYSPGESLQPALATEIANVIKGAQLNMPEVEGSIDLLKTTKSDPQMLETLNTLRHAMGDRYSTFTEKAKANYVPQERIDQILGPTAKEAISRFDKTQADYRAAHPDQFGGAPVKAPPAVGAMPLITSPSEAAKLGKGAQFRFMQNGQEMIGTVP